MLLGSGVAFGLVAGAGAALDAALPASDLRAVIDLVVCRCREHPLTHEITFRLVWTPHLDEAAEGVPSSDAGVGENK